MDTNNNGQVCDEFCAHMWRPNVCRVCFMVESLHVLHDSSGIEHGEEPNVKRLKKNVFKNDDIMGMQEDEEDENKSDDDDHDSHDNNNVGVTSMVNNFSSNIPFDDDDDYDDNDDDDDDDDDVEEAGDSDDDTNVEMSESRRRMLDAIRHGRRQQQQQGGSIRSVIMSAIRRGVNLRPVPEVVRRRRRRRRQGPSAAQHMSERLRRELRRTLRTRSESVQMDLQRKLNDDGELSNNFHHLRVRIENCEGHGDFRALSSLLDEALRMESNLTGATRVQLQQLFSWPATKIDALQVLIDGWRSIDVQVNLCAQVLSEVAPQLVQAMLNDESLSVVEDNADTLVLSAVSCDQLHTLGQRMLQVVQQIGGERTTLALQHFSHIQEQWNAGNRYGLSAVAKLHRALVCVMKIGHLKIVEENHVMASTLRGYDLSSKSARTIVFMDQYCRLCELLRDNHVLDEHDEELDCVVVERQISDMRRELAERHNQAVSVGTRSGQWDKPQQLKLKRANRRRHEDSGLSQTLKAIREHTEINYYDLDVHECHEMMMRSALKFRNMSVIKHLCALFNNEVQGAWLFDACTSGYVEAVEMMLDTRSVGVDARNAGGNTPLMLACRKGDFQMAQELLKRGANPLAVNNLQFSACSILASKYFHAPPRIDTCETPTLPFASYFDCANLSDVVLATDDGSSFYCHRIVLCVASPVFKAMLDTECEWMDTLENEIHLDGISGAAMEVVLKYCYRGTCRLVAGQLDVDMEVLELADRYMISELKRLVQEQMQKRLNEDNCVLVYYKATGLNAPLLQAACANFVLVNYANLKQDTDILTHILESRLQQAQ